MTNDAAIRYSVLPILLIEAAAIVAVDCLLRSRGSHRQVRSAGPAFAAAALVVVLAFGWIVDFRYPGIRSADSWNWGQIAAKWEYDCAHSRTGEITEKTAVTVNTLPGANIHP